MSIRQVIVAAIMRLVPEIIELVRSGKSDPEVIAHAKRRAIEEAYEAQARARGSK